MSSDKEKIAEIAKGLTKAQRAAWRDAEWQGEYYAPPGLPVWDRPAMRRLDLIDRENCVTTLGEALISYLNPPSEWWRKPYLLLRAHILKEQKA